MNTNVSKFGAAETFIFIGEFLLNCVESVAIGGVFGLIATWLLKKGKGLEEEAAF